MRVLARSRCAIGCGLTRRARNNRAIVLDCERELCAVQHIASRRCSLLDGVGFATDKAFHFHRAFQSLSGCRGVGPDILLGLSVCATELARDLIRCVGNVYSAGALLVKDNLDRRILGNNQRTAVGDCPASRNRAHRFDGAGFGYLELPGGQLFVSRRRF
ncbi:unknown [Eggerthella sp. CAG:209]|nr:unknown [Eggerthella sp. CAG:209]